MRIFNLIWFGQFISLTGSAITTFGLGVWVFQATGSVTYYGTLVLIATLPGLLVLPVAGALVDRWNRRHALIFGDSGAAITPAVVAVLHYTGELQLWHVYLLVALSSVFTAFQWPAMSALVPEIVPTEELGRANGRIGLTDGIGRLLGAALGGGLYVLAGLAGLLVIDALTFLVAISTVLVTARWAPVDKPGSRKRAKTDKRPLWRDIADGWAFIRGRPGLFGLLLFFAATNLAIEFVMVLIPPLVLSSNPPAVLGVVEAIGWAGMLIGGAYMSLRREPSRRVKTILVITAVNGALVLVCGVSPTPWVVATALFAILGGYAVINAVTATLWQLKTPRDMQGRVFAVRRAVAWSTDPISYAMAGPLVDLVANPMLRPGGPLASTVGQITGSGPGSGIALAFLVAGMGLLAASAVTVFRPRIRQLEKELPDALVHPVPPPDDTTRVGVSHVA